MVFDNTRKSVGYNALGYGGGFLVLKKKKELLKVTGVTRPRTLWRLSQFSL